MRASTDATSSASSASASASASAAFSASAASRSAAAAASASACAAASRSAAGSAAGAASTPPMSVVAEGRTFSVRNMSVVRRVGGALRGRVGGRGLVGGRDLLGDLVVDGGCLLELGGRGGVRLLRRGHLLGQCDDGLVVGPEGGDQLVARSRLRIRHLRQVHDGDVGPGGR